MPHSNLQCHTSTVLTLADSASGNDAYNDPRSAQLKTTEATA
ncbi:hypothetical protein [Vibrio furnissii]|nr:hypothetical protein [Vibrio furnissii]